MTHVSPKNLCRLIVLLTVLTGMVAHADDSPPFADYRTESWYLPQSPSVTGGPVGALFNPATWSITDQVGTDFWWNDRSVRGGLDNYGLAFGKNLGFSVNSTTFGTRSDNYKIYDYQIGLSSGSRIGSFGLAYRWAHGETQRTPRQKALSLGFINRQSRFASFGASGVMSLESNSAQYVFDLGIRPLGRHWLTLFADYTVNNDQAFFNAGTWGAGLEVRPISGLHLGVRARQQVHGDDWDYSLVAGLTLNDFNATAMPRYNQDGDLGGTSFLLRSQPPFSGLPVETPLVFKPKNAYYPINLENRVLTYQKYRYFDEKRVAWLDLLALLQKIEESGQIKGVVINLAGFNGRPSLLWEFRQELAKLQAAGKEIIIHADRLNQRTYYLASVADHLTLDQWGEISIPGLALSRSYLKGTLEKIGVGFQEHRYFKYKSAAETLSRDTMSEADREQRQRIVDVIYERLQEDISSGRNLDAGKYDEVVDELGQLTANEAIEMGLADGISRWNELPQWLKEKRGGKFASPDIIRPTRHFYDDTWGPAMKIPVVYTVGPCAMDTGIKGRTTSAYLRKLVKDPTVAAVVLRADSPGGDPLPSDLVADAIRQLKAAGKPVIISQGDVAASGGYWISMDGTKILTTPMTITGSIGVISGWVWDDGIAEKMGVSSDYVSRGRHADLYANVNLPLLGSLPRRPMDDSELERAENLIRGMYDDFLSAVATGRNLDKDDVHTVAQGRVWMGGDAIERGLCDQFGTLRDAIDLAKAESGLPEWRAVELVEYPPRGMFQMPSLLPNLPSFWGVDLNLMARLENKLTRALVQAERPLGQTPLLLPGLGNEDSHYILQMHEAAGQPRLVISPELLPDGWKNWD